MSEELEALARRAMACKAWRWTDGMAAVGPWRVLAVAEDGYPMSMFATAHHHPRGWWGLAGQPGAAREVVPDLADRATLGCLEGLVCEAWRDPDAHLMRLTGMQTFGNWRMVGNPPAGVLGRMSPDGYPTRAEALVAALVAASGVAP